MQPTEQIKQNSHNDQLLVIRWPIACPVAPEGDSSPCLGAGAFLVWVHESKLAGKTKYAVSSYFYISLYVRKQSSVLFPAPQPGEVGETGSRCRERQKEGRSKRSRKNNKKNPNTASLCSVKQYILEKTQSTPQVFLSRDIQQSQELIAFFCNIQMLLHLQSYKKNPTKQPLHLLFA